MADKYVDSGGTGSGLAAHPVAAGLSRLRASVVELATASVSTLSPGETAQALRDLTAAEASLAAVMKRG